MIAIPLAGLAVAGAFAFKWGVTGRCGRPPAGGRVDCSAWFASQLVGRGEVIIGVAV